MERLTPILAILALSSPAWAQLSSPVILSPGTPTAASSPAPTAVPPASSPVASRSGGTLGGTGAAAQPYLPPSLSPQAQINSATQKQGNTPPASNTATPAESNPFSQPMSDVNHIRTVPAHNKKPIEFRRRKEGRISYSITVTQPRVEISLYSGACFAENRRELRQQLIDRGLDSRKTTILHAAYAATPTGRVKGCWYYVRQGDYFRIALENGQGEDFAREQVDRVR